MALKIPKARLQNGGLISASEFEINLCGSAARQVRPEFLCPSSNCGIPLSFVRGNDSRAAHFRRRVGSEHQVGCRFNVPSLVDIIARGACEYFVRDLHGGPMAFRLLIAHHGPMDCLSEAADCLVRDESGESIGIGVSYIRRGRVDLPYISALNKVLMLWHSVEDSAAVSRLITVKWHGQDIAWRDFFFERERYPALCKLVSSHNYKRSQHPICVAGKIKACRNEQGNSALSLQLYANVSEAGAIIPWVNIGDSDFAEHIGSENVLERYVLVYGKWAVGGNRDSIIPIRLNVEHPHQILFITNRG